MQIRQIFSDKKNFLNLLLLADESERMIDRYLERGDMYVLSDGQNTVAECVVTKEADGVCELKNLAVAPAFQRKGYGRQLVEYVSGIYRKSCHTLLVGTGESPLTLGFYERCGFVYSHRVRNFFVDNYDHPITEGGVQLVDMVYLRKTI